MTPHCTCSTERYGREFITSKFTHKAVTIISFSLPPLPPTRPQPPSPHATSHTGVARSRAKSLSFTSLHLHLQLLRLLQLFHHFSLFGVRKKTLSRLLVPLPSAPLLPPAPPPPPPPPPPPLTPAPLPPPPPPPP